MKDQIPMVTKSSKTSHFKPDGQLLVTEETVESESLDSVEITQPSKGPPKITVKAYRSHVTDAGDAALAEYKRLTGLLAKEGGEA